MSNTHTPIPVARIPVALFVRVSTNRQETDRQITELRNFSEARNWEVVEVVEEAGVSGSSHNRPGLDRLMELARDKKIRKIVVHEISRLGRRNSVAHKFLEDVTELGVSIFWLSQQVDTLLENGKRNPMAMLMFAFLAENARAEKELMVERVRSGMAEARRKGTHLGRRKGTTESDDAILEKHPDVVRRLKEGQSVRNTAKLVNKSPVTVLKVKRIVEGWEP